MTQDPEIGLGRDALLCVYRDSAECAQIIGRDFKAAKRQLEGKWRDCRQHRGTSKPLRSPCAWDAITFFPKRIVSNLSAHAKRRQRSFCANCMIDTRCTVCCR